MIIHHLSRVCIPHHNACPPLITVRQWCFESSYAHRLFRSDAVAKSAECRLLVRKVMSFQLHPPHICPVLSQAGIHPDITLDVHYFECITFTFTIQYFYYLALVLWYIINIHCFEGTTCKFTMQCFYWLALVLWYNINIHCFEGTTCTFTMQCFY